MDLSNHVILDVTSGTHFAAAHAVLLPYEDNADTLNNGSDQDLIDLGEEVGEDLEQLINSNGLAESIADILWGNDTPWTPDTLDSISEAFQIHRPDLFSRFNKGEAI